MCTRDAYAVAMRTLLGLWILALLALQIGKLVYTRDLLGLVTHFTNYTLAALTLMYVLAFCTTLSRRTAVCNVRSVAPYFAAVFLVTNVLIVFVVAGVTFIYLQNTVVLNSVVAHVGLGLAIIADDAVHGWQLVALLVFMRANPVLVRYSVRALYHRGGRACVYVTAFVVPAFIFGVYVIVVAVAGLNVSAVYHVAVASAIGVGALFGLALLCNGLLLAKYEIRHSFLADVAYDERREKAVVYWTDVDDVATDTPFLWSAAKFQ